jgi:transcriptional regulator with XRE-family HTH domain
MNASMSEKVLATRRTLGANLTRLMARSRETNGLLASAPQVQTATENAGVKIGRSTVDRIKKGNTPVNIDYVSILAEVFHVEPWHLLTPDFDPQNPPVLRLMGSEEEKLYHRIAASVAKELSNDPRP